MAVGSSSTSLDDLAARSAGIVARSVLLAHGWSESGVKRAVRAGALVPVAAGVYRVRGAPWTREASRHAAVAIAGRGAALARWSAAELLGFAGARPGPHQVLVPHSRRATTSAPDLVTVSRTNRLDPADLTEVNGVAATVPARTLLDLARDVDPARLAELTTEAIRRAGLTLDHLDAVLARDRRSPGRSQLRCAVRLLGDDGHRSRSMVEVTALAALVDAGLPRPEVAYTVRAVDGRILAEVDLAYPAQRLAIEIDGYRWHSSPARKRADEERQNRLVLAGWTVLRFSAIVVRQTPSVLVEAVSAALRTV
jgi:hypothetical protein